MREIKFRACDKEKKVMICEYEQKTPEIYNLKVGSDIHRLVWKIGNHYDTLMQYTGLKDKNGKEIYEGDILSLYIDPSDEDKQVIAKVIFGKYEDDEKYSTKFHLGWFIEYKDSFGPGTRSLYDLCQESEIIGNIHEHPHLLENK